MKNFRITAIAQNGKVVFEVPESFNGKELEITIAEREDQVKKFHEMPVEERIKILEQYKGKAKYPDTSIDKYEVYEQSGNY